MAFLILFFIGCNNNPNQPNEKTEKIVKKLIPNLLYGIDLNEFDVETKKIRRGDTFGKIIEDNGIDYPYRRIILEPTL